jgi:hypothetical protein
MFVGYFKNAAGKYHARIYIGDEAAALALLFAYKGIVPEIVITDDGDSTTAQSRDGAITFPTFSGGGEEYLRSQYPEKSLPDFNDLAAVEEYTRRAIQSLLRMRECPERHEGWVDLMALAARHNLNLYNYGYQPAEIVLRQEARAGV